MNVVHMITGYDKATERLAFEFPVPAADLQEMRDIAHVKPSDVEAAGSYPLDQNAARFVAGRFKLPMAIERCDWFFEPFAVQAESHTAPAPDRPQAPPRIIA